MVLQTVGKRREREKGVRPLSPKTGLLGASHKRVVGASHKRGRTLLFSVDTFFTLHSNLHRKTGYEIGSSKPTG